jgi:hypothetical protein
MDPVRVRPYWSQSLTWPIDYIAYLNFQVCLNSILITFVIRLETIASVVGQAHWVPVGSVFKDVCRKIGNVHFCWCSNHGLKGKWYQLKRAKIATLTFSNPLGRRKRPTPDPWIYVSPTFSTPVENTVPGLKSESKANLQFIVIVFAYMYSSERAACSGVCLNQRHIVSPLAHWSGAVMQSPKVSDPNPSNKMQLFGMKYA